MPAQRVPQSRKEHLKLTDRTGKQLFRSSTLHAKRLWSIITGQAALAALAGLSPALLSHQPAAKALLSGQFFAIPLVPPEPHCLVTTCPTACLIARIRRHQPVCAVFTSSYHRELR